MAFKTSAKSRRRPTTEAPAPVSAPARWSELLERAVREPGIVSEAYSAFWNYSMGNQLLA